MNIFVADDSRSTRDLVAEVLRLDGHVVVEACDGQELLQQLADVRLGLLPEPDLLLVDVLMPNLSGLFVLKAIQHMAIRPPVILMTVIADRSVYVVGQRLGAAGLLAKPFHAAALRDKIDEVCGRRALAWWQLGRRGAAEPGGDPDPRAPLRPR